MNTLEIFRFLDQCLLTSFQDVCTKSGVASCLLPCSAMSSHFSSAGRTGSLRVIFHIIHRCAIPLLQIVPELPRCLHTHNLPFEITGSNGTPSWISSMYIDHAFIPYLGIATAVNQSVVFANLVRCQSSFCGQGSLR